jgi:hypothetical protein
MPALFFSIQSEPESHRYASGHLPLIITRPFRFLVLPGIGLLRINFFILFIHPFLSVLQAYFAIHCDGIPVVICTNNFKVVTTCMQRYFSNTRIIPIELGAFGEKKDRRSLGYNKSSPHLLFKKKKNLLHVST